MENHIDNLKKQASIVVGVLNAGADILKQHNNTMIASAFKKYAKELNKALRDMEEEESNQGAVIK